MTRSLIAHVQGVCSYLLLLHIIANAVSPPASVSGTDRCGYRCYPATTRSILPPKKQIFKWQVFNLTLLSKCFSHSVISIE